ncbi:MAG: Uma2 family endonuclease [Fimbriiglobus sp.]
MTATAAPATARRFVFADDLLKMWEDGKSFEVVGAGQLMEFEVSKESSRVAGQVFYHLETYARGVRPVWVFPEGTSYRCFPDDPERTRKADTSVVLLDRMPPAAYADEGHCVTVPDLVVEVISPNDKAVDVEHKIGEWLAAGVKLLWEVYPNTRTVHVYREDGPFAFLRAAAMLTAPDLLPGFAVPVADLFRRPGEPRPA